ncbi:hypothetical protein [Paraburkholderia susongensis]|uniref:hypothetical protein n=1 Tax=Paraburkholderia susongensis TaxID=1515439 RepID=UPI00117D01FD|nr:hypothetical protein [Paraburkholderia susongensis]
MIYEFRLQREDNVKVCHWQKKGPACFLAGYRYVPALRYSAWPILPAMLRIARVEKNGLRYGGSSVGKKRRKETPEKTLEKTRERSGKEVGKKRYGFLRLFMASCRCICATGGWMSQVSKIGVRMQIVVCGQWHG